MILLDPSLTRAERKAALAHELVHVERGGGVCAPFALSDERRVNRVVALRLVPPDELEHFLEQRLEFGSISTHDVEEEFDVPSWVAQIALREQQGANT